MLQSLLMEKARTIIQDVLYEKRESRYHQFMTARLIKSLHPHDQRTPTKGVAENI